jgi:hypothetical protein
MDNGREQEILLNGIHTLDLIIARATDPQDALKYWNRKHTLLECLYRLLYKREVTKG